MSRSVLSARETLAWMEANCLTEERFDQMVRGQAAGFALRDHVAGAQSLDAYWDSHPGAFAVAHVVRLRVRDRQRAAALAAEMRDGADFYAILEREFIARRLVALPHRQLEVVRRGQLPSADADAVFASTVGAVAGPFETGGVFDLMRIIRHEVADLADAETRTAVSNAVFDAWLAQQRHSANIEWFWGLHLDVPL